MIGRLMDRVIRRQRDVHQTAAVDRRTREGLNRIARIVEDQTRPGSPPARVNAIYDRVVVRSAEEEERR